MLERLETELSSLISFVANTIPQMADNEFYGSVATEREEIIEIDSIILPCLCFLTNWLSCEERAETSYNIGTDLIACSKIAYGRITQSNEIWNDVYIRFISGFYKATNGETSAAHYFGKTDLIESILANNPKTLQSNDLIGQILVEYLLYLDNSGTPSSDIESRLQNLNKFGFLNSSNNLLPGMTRWTVFMKMMTLTSQSMTDNEWSTNMFEQAIEYLSRAYLDGEINPKFLDQETVHIGFPIIFILRIITS